MRAVSTVSLALALAVPLLAAGPPARAAGYLVYDISGEALGKGSAVTASTREPAAIWFNPGALGFMPGGVAASVGGTFATAAITFTPADGSAEVDNVQDLFFLPAFFAEGAVNDRLHLGISALTAFGLGVEWPADWVGREAAIKATIQTFALNPTVGYRLDDRWSVGAGFQAVRGTVDFTNGLPELVGGTVRVGGGTWGFGGNAGVMFKAAPEVVHLGLTYRSRVVLAFTGRADFDPGPEFAGALRDQPGKSRVTLPDIITAGVMWRPRPDLELTFDPNYILWSTYDQVKLDFESAPDRVLARNFKNGFTFRLGADWSTPAEGLNLRAGFIFDQNPSPEDTLAPSLPDSHRLDFAAGVGYRRGWFKADIGYLLVYFLPSEARGGVEGPEGTYRNLSHLLGLTVAARFGQ